MKMITIMFLLAGLAAAQQAPAPEKPQTPAGGASGGFQIESPAPAKPNPTQPMAKSNEELAEYNSVLTLSQTDVAGADAAATAFLQKYPESELQAVLYSRLLQVAYARNDADRAVKFADRVLILQPENTIALVLSASVFAERTEDTDLDRDQKLTKGIERATKAVQTIDTGLVLPANVTPEQAQGAKNMLRSMAHSAMGQIESIKKDYPAAEKHLSQATELAGTRPDPLTLYRLAIAQHQQKKFKEAKASNDKALAAAQAENDANVLALAQKEKEILDKVK